MEWECDGSQRFVELGQKELGNGSVAWTQVAGWLERCSERDSLMEETNVGRREGEIRGGEGESCVVGMKHWGMDVPGCRGGRQETEVQGCVILRADACFTDEGFETDAKFPNDVTFKDDKGFKAVFFLLVEFSVELRFGSTVASFEEMSNNTDTPEPPPGVTACLSAILPDVPGNSLLELTDSPASPSSV